MALTISGQRIVQESAMRETIQKIAFDTSYPTGGYPVTPGMVGLTTLDFAQLNPVTAGGHAARWDSANAKIMLFIGAVGVLVEETNATDVHTESITFRALGS